MCRYQLAVKLFVISNESYNLICFCILKMFLKKIEIFLFFLLQINIFLIFSDHFDVLVSKIIFKNKKILI
jgi:uncharacterized RDD family membrane protein YckC